jgi:serine/threonine-protein kinase
MGTVYRVHDKQLGEVVALKMLRPEHTEEDASRFVREVRIARRVTHENVVRTYDLGHHRGTPFLTMEHIEGVDLAKRLREGRLPLEDVLRVARAIAEGLVAAHQAGVVHRDLKPANVLLASDNRVLLTDFGIARHIHHDARTHATGSIIGTPDYMSPEQVRDVAVGPSTDMYAFGTLLYEMLLGEPPFTGLNAMDVAVRRLHEAPRHPKDVDPAVDSELADLAMRLMAREPEQRPSALSAAQRLRHLGQEPDATQDMGIDAPMHTNGPSLVVMAFRYRGAPTHAYLGEGLAEELVDVLTHTEGIRVTSSAGSNWSGLMAVPESADESDTNYVVSGTVQLHGEQVRVRLRLAEPNGTQVWSARFDAPLGEVFELEQQMAQRLAESLRLKVGALRMAGSVPVGVVGLYMAAKKLMRGGSAQVDEAVALLERAHAQAPNIPTIMASRAMAAVRAALWNDSMTDPEGRQKHASQTLAEAQQYAGEWAETHLAAAAWHHANGDLESELSAVLRALDLAPTSADGHLRLAEVQMAAGRIGIAERRFALALELDPNLEEARLGQVRLAAFAGDEVRAHTAFDRAASALGRSHTSVLTAQFRLGLWTGRRALVEDARRWLTDSPAHGLLSVLIDFSLGALPLEALDEFYATVRPWLRGGVHALTAMIVAESCLARGESSTAIERVLESAEHFHDVDWLTRCPLIEPLRTNPQYLMLAGGIRAVVEASFSRNATTRVTLG